MKFSINQSELQNALSVVLKGVSTRSTLPILSGVYLDVQGDSLTLQTTDLELSVQYTVAALVEEPGRAVVPGKLFADIVKNLPDAAVHVDADEESAVITCDTASFSIKALDPEDFPGFPHVDVTQRIEIPFTQFSSMVRRVARVVSKDESRAILTGVLITLEDNHLKMVATDSYRLAITETELENATADEFQAVIAGTFLQDLAALPKTDSPVALALAENQIVVTYQDTVFVNRRLEGNFPNYRQLLPESYTTRVSMPVEHLIAAVKRSSLLGQSSSPVRFDINVASQTTQLSSVAQDVGSAQETIACTGEGEDVEIAFNYAYLLDGLAAIGAEEVFLEVQSSLKPGIFKAPSDENFLYLVMPVRIS
ncbi:MULTISPECIES: DNA polymerase III subunit beta [Gordonibacter]|uniref:Beta sliding clamp n=1 Tax=Gordonibacter faecis TaxID=3047475 RepID=A0ABT7DKA2_9ACTN|nr:MULTISPECIES: DNA polymerase III subunit beta [unclassified Gordonibacter]MDJ1649962.1 DNA polymerase III subunit beta [Gordonibacter sp. KGMB12511]HIW75894.1 DNA polymerase III subunit beta [Candidatus Gordonibacter avicola]